MDKPERILSAANRLDEGPVWNTDEHVLYWVDIEGNCFYRYDPVVGTLKQFDVSLPVGVLRFRKSGGLVMATRDGFAFWDSPSQSLSFIANPEPGKPQGRFNDGAIDCRGRFWAGTLAPGMTSSLYRLDPDLSIHNMETGIGVSNGIGWSPDHRTMYHTDSRIRAIYAYDFDAETGAIANRRIFVQALSEVGVPDGLAVDSEGFVWSVRWGGWKVTRYDPGSKVEREIRLPVEYPTSCAFGGEALDELFITSAWMAPADGQKRKQPLTGLFCLKTTVRGLREPYFAG